MFICSTLYITGCCLPPQWCTKVAQLCGQFNDDQPTLPTIQRHLTLEESVKSPILYLLPPIILWSPVEQFQGTARIKLFCPKCIQLGEATITLSANGWRDAMHGERSEPRKVYGSDGITLLVGRVYKCSHGHEVVGYHPGLLEQIPACFIPFRLWHITGFTTEFIELLVGLMTTGISIHGIRNFWYKKQVSQYYNRKILFARALHSCKESCDTFPSIDEWKCFFSAFIPSPHALSGCFLADFWSKEIVYSRCMQSMTIDDSKPWLSLDHTFASTSKLHHQ